MKDKIELNIIALANSESSKGNYVIILQEINGNKRLPIVIGAFEAQAIAISLENMNPTRPLTHDLMINMILEFDASISEVIIHDIIDNTFHAKVILKDAAGKIIDIDSRSSDAIALAVRCGCPIYTYSSIIGNHGLVNEQTSKSFSNKRGNLSEYSLEELEKMLEQVLQKEDYESASKIRDAIQNKQSE